MFNVHRLAAAALALLGSTAQAQFGPPPAPLAPPPQTTLNFVASASDDATNLSQTVGGETLVITGPTHSGGPLVAHSGIATATVFANADPVRGMLKSLASASLQGTTSIGYAGAEATLLMTDTLRFSGDGETVDVNFQLYWDTVLSGMNQNLVGTSAVDWHQQAVSNTVVGLSWQTDNPYWNPEITCEPGAEWCEPQFVSHYHEDGFSLVSVAGEGYFHGQRNGRYTDSLTLTMALPVATDIRVVYQVQNQVQCFYLAQCEVTVDASHSNYIGISAGPGVSYSSASGYQYLGLDAAAPVPEPATWALSLLGAAAVLARKRRRPA